MTPAGAYDRYGSLVYRYCTAAVADPRLAAEATISAFRTTASLGHFGNAADNAVMVWPVLLRQAMRACRTVRRGRYVPPPPNTDVPPPEHGVLPYSFDQVQEAFTSLSGDDQQLVWHAFLMTGEAESRPEAARTAIERFVTAVRIAGIPETEDLE